MCWGRDWLLPDVERKYFKIMRTLNGIEPTFCPSLEATALQQSGFIVQQMLNILTQVYPLLVEIFASQKPTNQAMRMYEKERAKQTEISNMLHHRNTQLNDLTYHVENIFLN